MHPHDIGDTNVERLLEAAYKPEPVDTAFAKQVEDEMCAAALAASKIQSAWPGLRYSEAPEDAAGASEYLSPGHPGDGEDTKRQIIRKRLGWAMGLAASVAACFLIYYARTHRFEPVLPRNAERKEINDTLDKIRPVSLREHKLSMGLTALPRPEAPTVKPVGVGTMLSTKAGERRRVTLADGSILYLNQNTTVKHVADRQIELSNGEVYLEVGPRESRTAFEEATFLVKTPGRVISALGTRFGVQADAQGPGVIVTQGKVKVSGLDREIRAGQQLPVRQKVIVPAPRASHLLDWTRELLAAAESPLVPSSKHAGGALLAIDPFGQEVTLTLRKFHVDVHIEDGFARTTIDQTYFNNNNWRMEGTFYFPLPPDASLSRLAMYVEDGDASRLMEGGMAERDHARDVFETIMTMRRDPALLEWVDGSTFKMRVFPLEGRKEKRILLSYTQRLPSLYGTMHYRFPAGHSMELVRDWSFEARVKHGANLRVTADSHPEMKIAPQGPDMLASATARNVKPSRDVTLEIYDSAAANANDGADFTSLIHENQHYMMLKYRPALAGERKRERRDWVILFETAANRDPLLARAQIDVVKNLLENVEHDDTFSLITANTRAALFDSKPRPLNKENVEAAIRFLEESHLIGALDMSNALAAARPLLSGAKNPYLVHVGAGIAAMGERKEDVLASEIPESVRYVGIGVGKRWSRAFMKMAADRTGGFFTQINPDEPIAWRTFELLATLNTPRLMELRVVDAEEKMPFLAETTSLAQGEELCAFARTQGPLPDKVVISGKLDGKAFSKTLEVKSVVPGAGYLPRTWAKLEIDRLLADGAEKNKKAIIGLSMAMYVMTPFTSLLVLETDQDYVTYKVDRGRKDHWAMYDSPHRIPTVYEPDPNQQVWNGIWNNPAPMGKKKTAQEVLSSILIRIPPSFLTIPGRQQNQQPMVLTAQQLLHMNYAIQEMREELDEAIVTGSSLNEQSDRIRMLALQPALKGLDMGAALARFDALSDSMTWNSRDELQGLSTFDNGTQSTFNAAIVKALASGGVANTDFQSQYTLLSQPPAGAFGVINPNYAARLTFGFEQPYLSGGGRSGFYGRSGASRLGWMTSANTWRLRENGKSSERLAEDLRFALEEARLPRRGFPDIDGSITGLDLLQTNTIEFFPPALATRSKARNLSITGGIIGGKSRRLEAARFDAEIKSLEVAGRFAKDSKSFQEHWLRDMAARLQSSRAQLNLIYQRPQVIADNRFFGDLTAFAPGLHTTLADIYSVVEAEAAEEKQPLPGVIHPDARKLIDKARSASWQALAIPGYAKVPGFTVTFNGAGQFAYERVLDTGLHEQVVCDGTALWTLYPDIGLGGRRMFNRFHHDELADMVPWFVPKAEDLARWADLKLVDDSTVAIVSRLPAAKDKDGKTLPTRELHLIFADDGRLAERRIVEVPSQKVLIRQTYDAQGVVKVINPRDNKVLAEMKLNLTKGQAPNLKPDTKDLLVMEFPIRTPGYLLGQITNWNGSFAKMDKLVEQLFVAYALSGDGHNSWQAFGERFHAWGDRRLGFYTLHNLTNTIYSRDRTYTWNNKQTTFNVEKEHPNSALAAFLAHYQQSLSQQATPLENLPGPKDGFIQRLARFRNLYAAWITDHPTRHGEKKVQEERAKALEFIQETSSPLFAWAILESVTRHGQPLPDDFHKAMAKVHKDMGEQFGLTYFARYENARSLQAANRNPEADKAFQELYLDAFKAGALPPIDASFLQALGQSAKDGVNSFANFLHDRLSELLKEERHFTATLLAWQTWQLGQQALADELFNRVLAGAQPKDKNAVILVGIEYLWHTGQLARADVLLQQVLVDPKVAERPAAWRLSSALAQRRGLLARSVAAQEKALDLEFRALPDVINLNTVRNDYRGLLSHYQQLATAIAILDDMPVKNKEFLAKVVRAADRWRSLDPDNVEVCQLTGRILQVLGAKELAWDYVTTPIGMKPNEAAPWLGLATTLQKEAEFELADRAYAMAYGAEPTNADILWQRAQNLQHMGKLDQARTLYRQLADGTWQPRFQGIQQQARWYLTR